ncbi:MAG: ABC transporter substrate-binding protein, partial [Pseudomonadota bacterium]
LFILPPLKAILLFAMIGLASCSAPPEPPIKLITNSWIGYSPLFYAKEKGWLEPLNIELSTVVSLNESMMTYKIGHFKGLTGTQYEFEKLQKQNADLVPIIMFNRSNGGDMVMSNISITSLKETTDSVDVFLEINSINSVVFKDFIKAHKLENKTFNFINKDPLKTIAQIKQAPITQPLIIVTYNPYNVQLLEHGFNVIASTKNSEEILVVDALYVKKSCITEHKADFIKLKQVINQAILDLQANPRAYYEKVKPYLENGSYKEFSASLNQIEWLNSELSATVTKKLNQSAFPIRDLL